MVDKLLSVKIDEKWTAISVVITNNKTWLTGIKIFVKGNMYSTHMSVNYLDCHLQICVYIFLNSVVKYYFGNFLN